MPKTKKPATTEKRDPIALEMGRRLAECRDARGWTQAKLAAETGWTVEDAEAGQAKGLSPSRIANYEQGLRRIGHEEAEIFGRIFAKPAAYFLVVIDEHEAEILIAMRKRLEHHQPDTRRRQPR